MVHDAADVPVGPLSLDSVRVQFDVSRLVSDAGLLVSATLAQRLGIKGGERVGGRSRAAVLLSVANKTPPRRALLLERDSRTHPQETR